MLKESHLTVSLNGSKTREWFRSRGLNIDRIPVDVCPFCGSTKRRTDGRNKRSGVKRYLCLNCSHRYASARMPDTITVPLSCLPSTKAYMVTRICDTCGREEVITLLSWRRAQPIRNKKGLDNCKSCSNRLCQTKTNSRERLRDRSNLEEKRWARAVKKRDNYACQCCGQVGRKLISHHILPWEHYPELRFDVLNGITLCTSCHAEYHASTGGTKRLFNCNRETLNAFIAMRRGVA